MMQVEQSGLEKRDFQLCCSLWNGKYWCTEKIFFNQAVFLDHWGLLHFYKGIAQKKLILKFYVSVLKVG